MKWVVPTCLLGKPIMKINAVTFITLSKNDYKNPKSRFTGKTFRVIIWGFWVLPGGKNPKPRHNMLLTSIKRRVLGNGSHFKLVFVPEHLGHRRARTEEPYYPKHIGVKKLGGNEFKVIFYESK